MISGKDEGFQITLNLVDRFREQFDSYKKTDYNETLTRRDFIDPFFKGLGWDVDNSNGHAEAYREVIHEDKVKVAGAIKAPDYSFRLPGGKRLFFVEAKKPSVYVKDDIHPAYQIRRYGWSAKLPISLITDFEELAVYDCTKKPKITDKASVARIKYLTFNEYLNEWDFIWDTFSKEKVLKGGFDKFIQADTHKKGTTTVDKEFLTSLDQWRTLLASAISKNNNSLDEDELNFVVQQTLDRIIFLRIAEDRGVEPYGKLMDSVKHGDYYKNLFVNFREADDKYNSGIFDFRKDKLSKGLVLDNKTLKSIISELYYPESPYEFSVLSVEILGSAYEQFLGKQITIDKNHRVHIEEKPEVRKAGGVYYTPEYIVNYIVENTVGKLMAGKSPKDISKIKIVDPACGSGSFLLGAYQYLLTYHKNYYTDNGKTQNKKIIQLTPDGNLTTAEKKRILLNNIHGVDIDVNAVEVTKLSLLLKCMEGETNASISNQIALFNDRVLPTLDTNIKSGNSLIDVDYYDSVLDFGEEKKIKPFSWEKAFPEVFKRGGFDIVIGNPPYVFGRDWKALGISDDIKNYLNRKFESSSYQLDMFSIFMEQGYNLVKTGGCSSFIVPNVWLNNSYSKATRKLILGNSDLLELINPIEKVFEGISVDTVIYISHKGIGTPESDILIKKISKKDSNVFTKLKFAEYFSGENAIPTSISTLESALVKKIASAGAQLGSLANITRGIHPYRTGGYGESAFIKGSQIQKDVDERPYHSRTVLKGYRPFIYGKDLKRFAPVRPKEYIKYGKWLAEPRDENFFIGERIYSRKILGEKLIVTIEKDDSIADQQVYVTKPKGQETKIEYIAAILGSKLMAFFIKKYFNEGDAEFPQIKVGQLKSLPIVIIDIANNKQLNLKDVIVASVEKLINLNIRISSSKLQTNIEELKDHGDHYEDKINHAIFNLYGLNKEEIDMVEGSFHKP